MAVYLTGFDDAYDQFERMRQQMDELFGGWSAPMGIRNMTPGGFPAVNVGASADRVDAYMFAAGLDPKSLEISLQQNLLSISGERKEDIPEQAEPYRNERFTGTFRRVLTLPDDVDPEKVDATYRDGILHITVQRHEAVEPRKIQVH